MRKIVISIFMMAIIFSSCGIGDKLNTEADPDAVENSGSEVNFQVTNDVKANKDYYYEYEIEYPKLSVNTTKSTERAVKVFNDEMKKFIDFYIKGFKGSLLNSKKEIVDVIIAEDSISASENSMVYSLNINYILNEVTTDVFSIKFVIDEFSLGAHANSYFQTYNYNLKKEKFLEIDDFLNVATNDDVFKLNALINKHFEDPLNCFDTKPSVLLKDVQFSLTKENVVFSYHPYILGAYSCGSSTIFIPIAELKEAKLWKR